MVLEIELVPDSLGFTQSHSDTSMFVFSSPTSKLLIAYVDDIIIIDNNNHLIDFLVCDLHHEFSLKDHGQLKYFLGIKVTRTKTQLNLTQSKHINDLMHQAEFVESKLCSTPMVVSPLRW